MTTRAHAAEHISREAEESARVVSIWEKVPEQAYQRVRFAHSLTDSEARQQSTRRSAVIPRIQVWVACAVSYKAQQAIPVLYKV